VSVFGRSSMLRARGDEPFAFEAPDESFGFSVARTGGWQFGPALGFEGQRSHDSTNGMLPKVGFTFELGGFVQYQLAPNFRLRTEVRQGIGGHKGLIGTVGADYVIRDADRWLFSIGPRVTVVNGRYSRAYFGIDPATSMTASLPEFRANGGLQAVGMTAGAIRQINARWGIYSYAKYDRLVADPGRSPVVRAFGTRDQLSGGIALSYTFGASCTSASGRWLSDRDCTNDRLQRALTGSVASFQIPHWPWSSWPIV
jgi:outer membrane protein